MSPLLLEAQHTLHARRVQLARRKKSAEKNLIQPKRSTLDEPLAIAHPNQVLTFHEWCQLNRISVRTGRRIIASGTGPTVTHLSPRRVGISIENNARWQASKARG